MKETKIVHIAITAIIIFVLAGFFLLFNSLASLKSDIENLKLTIALQEKNNQKSSENTSASYDTQTQTTSTPEIIEKDTKNDSQNTTTTKDVGILVPSAIIFETNSSSKLAPQYPITIIIDNLTKYNDGSVVVNFKMYTDKASGPTTIDPKEIFQLVGSAEASGDVWQQAIEVKGSFDSVPPKSVSSGAVLFQGFPEKTIIVLQVGSGDETKFYEFNFSTKTYKEVILG